MDVGALWAGICSVVVKSLVCVEGSIPNQPNRCERPMCGVCCGLERQREHARTNNIASMFPASMLCMSREGETFCFGVF